MLSVLSDSYGLSHMAEQVDGSTAISAARHAMATGARAK
jgi:hypothetical protein